MIEESITERKNSVIIYCIDRATNYRSIKFFCKNCSYIGSVNSSSYDFDFICPNCNHTLLSPFQSNGGFEK